MWGCWVAIIVVAIILWLYMREKFPQNSESYEKHNVFLGGSPSWELNPEWELCAPCFARCAQDQLRGRIQPELGVTGKDVCARKCARYCQGFAYQWPDSIHVGFKKHGM